MTIIFRGINLSEYAGEGREKPNHQLAVDISVPLGDFGTFGFGTWFEWYADQEKLTGDGANIQEIDYILSWSYDLEPIATSMTLGWIAYVLPNLPGSGDRTFEVFVNLEHNDAWMWRWTGYEGEDGILNPTLLVAYDYDTFNGVWIEVGTSHDFALTEELTFTPSMLAAIDCGYLDSVLGNTNRRSRIGFTQFGLQLAYDLTKALSLPETIGSVSISGDLNWTVPTSPGHQAGLDDEFWGGVTLAWSF